MANELVWQAEYSRSFELVRDVGWWSERADMDGQEEQCGEALS
jgi:hypothetical protein